MHPIYPKVCTFLRCLLLVADSHQTFLTLFSRSGIGWHQSADSTTRHPSPRLLLFQYGSVSRRKAFLTVASAQAGGKARPRALTNTSALNDLVNELVTTERTYVQRLRLLKELYADPLRSYARSKDTAIIPAYEAKVLFGNIDQLLPANEAFLRDLEQMSTPSGPRTVGGVGDVALHHFGKLKTFDCYRQYYHKREEAQAIFKREMAKKSSTGFAPFIEVGLPLLLLMPA